MRPCYVKCFTKLPCTPSIVNECPVQPEELLRSDHLGSMRFGYPGLSEHPTNTRCIPSGQLAQRAKHLLSPEPKQTHHQRTEAVPLGERDWRIMARSEPQHR